MLTARHLEDYKKIFHVDMREKCGHVTYMKHQERNKPGSIDIMPKIDKTKN